jgi:phage gpG-like protein
MDNIKGLDEVKRKLKAAQDYIKNDIPLVVGVEAVNHFKENFDQEGFVDKSLTKWMPRKDKTNSRKILSDTRELQDSLEYRVEGNTVIISSDKVYAQIHNEGGVIPVSAQMRKFFWAKHYEAKQAGNEELAESWKFQALSKQIVIPKRQFIGESEVLGEKIAAKIKKDLSTILNS